MVHAQIFILFLTMGREINGVIKCRLYKIRAIKHNSQHKTVTHRQVDIRKHELHWRYVITTIGETIKGLKQEHYASFMRLSTTTRAMASTSSVIACKAMSGWGSSRSQGAS
jgi:hypothetical protein